MNDYFARGLARERQADYLREIAHDELVAQVHRGAEAVGPAAHRDSVAQSLPLRVRSLLGRFSPWRLAAPSDRLMTPDPPDGPLPTGGGRWPARARSGALAPTPELRPGAACVTPDGRRGRVVVGLDGMSCSYVGEAG